jgi:hypothetical protein
VGRPNFAFLLVPTLLVCLFVLLPYLLILIDLYTVTFPCYFLYPLYRVFSTLSLLTLYPSIFSLVIPLRGRGVGGATLFPPIPQFSLKIPLLGIRNLKPLFLPSIPRFSNALFLTLYTAFFQHSLTHSLYRAFQRSLSHSLYRVFSTLSLLTLYPSIFSLTIPLRGRGVGVGRPYSPIYLNFPS